MPRPPVMKQRVLEMLRGADDGMTTRQVVERLGVSNQLVSKVVHELGDQVEVLRLDHRGARVMRLHDAQRPRPEPRPLAMRSDWPFDVGELIRVVGERYENGCIVVELEGVDRPVRATVRQDK